MHSAPQAWPAARVGCDRTGPAVEAAQTLCPGCGGPTATEISGLLDTRFGIEGEYQFRRCPRCGLERLFPLPEPAQLKQLYERFYNFSGERGTPYTGLREWFLSSPLYRWWILVDGDVSFHARKGAGRLLDIGCNEGRTLKQYAGNGFQAEGTELNEKAAARARAAGFAVFTGPLEQFAPAALYDVAVLSNVLEHVADPQAMLIAVRRLLNPGGQLWISCPNSESWLRRVFGRWWIHWHVPFHLTQFSSRTLGDLLAASGFELVEMRQITPALWAASSLVVRLFARRGRPTRQLRNPVLIFPLLILCRGLLFPLLGWGNRKRRGDCLVAVALKAD